MKGGMSMQQPTRYYITRSGDEPTLRSVRISQQPGEHARGTDADLVKADSRSIAPDESGTPTPTHGSTVKERLQEVIRKRATTQ